jgi:hypothetical protein
MSAKDLKIGSTVWVLDENTRVYRRTTAGRSIGSPLRRPMWGEAVIVDETSRSWIALPLCRAERYDGDLKSEHSVIKIPKTHDGTTYTAASNGFRCPLVALTAQAVEDDVWWHNNKHQLLEAAQGADTSTLRKIAELIGYTATED